MKTFISQTIKELQTRGRFKHPDEVDEFFEKKLWECSNKTIEMIAKEEGWEESETYYKNKIGGVDFSDSLNILNNLIK